MKTGLKKREQRVILAQSNVYMVEEPHREQASEAQPRRKLTTCSIAESFVPVKMMHRSYSFIKILDSALPAKLLHSLQVSEPTVAYHTRQQAHTVPGTDGEEDEGQSFTFLMAIRKKFEDRQTDRQTVKEELHGKQNGSENAWDVVCKEASTSKTYLRKCFRFDVKGVKLVIIWAVLKIWRFFKGQNVLINPLSC